MKTATTLLLEVKQAVGCPFLSDLHSPQWFCTPRAQTAIMAIRLDRFSPEVWNQAASYILQKNCAFLTAEQAKLVILEVSE